MPSHNPKRQYKVGDRIHVNLHHGRIEEAVIRAVIQDGNETKLQVDVVGGELLNFAAIGVSHKPQQC